MFSHAKGLRVDDKRVIAQSGRTAWRRLRVSAHYGTQSQREDVELCRARVVVCMMGR
jgi:hypothetical protein